MNNIDKFIERDIRLPLLLDRMHENGKKTFLLTNSDYRYTEKVMKFLFDVPSAKGRLWKSYFDFIVVDARFVFLDHIFSFFLLIFLFFEENHCFSMKVLFCDKSTLKLEHLKSAHTQVRSNQVKSILEVRVMSSQN